jgi:hypothetical protein
MSSQRAARSMRSVTTAFLVAILGVLALDATAIVAAPGATPTSSPTHRAGPTGLFQRQITWSGYHWLVANGNGPDGPNTLSDSATAVHVDSHGRLHLALTKVNGAWRGVQLELTQPLNYGTYRFITASSVAKLAKPGVLGMFVYKRTTSNGMPVKYVNEIDLEDSRALHPDGYPLDAQYVVQPYYVHHPPHLHRYPIRSKYKTVTHQFTWRGGKVIFNTWAGSGSQGKRLGHFRFKGYNVPAPMNEHVYINFHLHPYHAPGKGSKSVVLKSFSVNGP